MKKIFITILFILPGCNDICEDQIIFDEYSPNKEYIATAFERNCGATTSFATIISMRHFGKTFNPNDYENWIFKMHGRVPIDVKWKGEVDLSISFFAGELLIQKTKWKDVNIRYFD